LEPLLPKSGRGTHITVSSKSLATPSDILSTCARDYLNWFSAKQLDPQARYDLMTTPIADKDKIDREVDLLRVARSLCPDLKVNIKESDIGWNEAVNTVFLLLHLTGKHTGYLCPA